MTSGDSEIVFLTLDLYGDCENLGQFLPIFRLKTISHDYVMRVLNEKVICSGMTFRKYKLE